MYVSVPLPNVDFMDFTMGYTCRALVNVKKPIPQPPTELHVGIRSS